MLTGATCYRPSARRYRLWRWKRLWPIASFALCLLSGVLALWLPRPVERVQAICAEADSRCVFAYPMGLPGENVTPETDNSLLFVVDEAHPLPKDYAQPNVLSLALRCGDSVCLENAQLALAEDAIVPLRLLLCRAEDVGYPNLTVWLGALSREEAAARFAARLQACLCCMDAETAFRTARAQTPLPGCGEHETGYAVDIVPVTAKGKAPLQGALCDTPAGKWLMENAWREGFVYQPLPEDGCHFRYVGKGWALALRCLGLTAPEAITLLHEKHCFTLYLQDGTPALYACQYNISFAKPTGWPFVAGGDNAGGTLAVCWNPVVYDWADSQAR